MKQRPRTRRRGRGEGSIFQRTDGRWSASLSLGYSPTGRRLRRTIYGDTKQEVLTELLKLQGQQVAGTLAAPSTMLLGDFLDRWLQDIAKQRVRETTYDNYRRTIDLHIIPHIGGTKMDKVKAPLIAWLYAELERGGVGGDNRSRCHSILRMALQTAVRWGLLSRNPCFDVDRPKIGSRKEIRPFTPEEAAVFLRAAAGDRLECLYVIALTTGMRMGEIFGLKWDCVDVENGVIHVRRTLRDVNGTLTLGEPKTKSSRRKIDLPQMTVNALHEHRERAIPSPVSEKDILAFNPWIAELERTSGFVFTNTLGGPMRKSHFHAAHFKPLLKRAGLPNIRFHDLRHTCATLLMMQGVHPKVVSERLGHSKVAITMDVYSHVLPTTQKDAASRFDQMFSAAS